MKNFTFVTLFLMGYGTVLAQGNFLVKNNGDTVTCSSYKETIDGGLFTINGIKCDEIMYKKDEIIFFQETITDKKGKTDTIKHEKVALNPKKPHKKEFLQIIMENEESKIYIKTSSNAGVAAATHAASAAMGTYGGGGGGTSIYYYLFNNGSFIAKLKRKNRAELLKQYFGKCENFVSFLNEKRRNSKMQNAVAYYNNNCP